MSFFDKLISGIGLKRIKEQITKPTTGDLRASRFALHVNNVVDLPRFTIWTAMQMRTDPVVQFGLHIRDALISPSDVEFETKNPELGEWLRKQWDVIWGKNWFKITQAKQWGYQGLEVLMKEDETTGFIDVIGLRDFSPFDARALSSEGETVGLRIRGHVRNAGAAGQGRLLMPQALWVPFASRWGNPYGWSIMRGAHSPWWEKWMTGGVKKVTQIRMIKDGYRGLMGRYPLDGKVTTDDGTELSWRDIIREVLENMNAAASVVLPSILDADGNQLLDIVPQPEAPDPKAIFEWGSRVDREIWFAQDVPQEIIEAASTGSGFSGRSIPFVVALQLIGGREFGSYMEAIDRMTLRPLAQLNFGNGPASEYKITPKSLPEIFAKMLGGSAMGGEAVGGAGQTPQGGPGEPTGGQPPQPGESGVGEPAAAQEPAGEFIDRKLADGRVVKVRNPNFRGGQFADFDESKVKREAKGTEVGGRFTSKPVAATATEAKEGVETSPTVTTAETSGQTDTKNFKRWFAGSRVRDNEGRPLAVTHVTTKTFESFKPGGFDPVASGPAIWFAGPQHKGGEPAAHHVSQKDPDKKTLTVFLRMNNPLVLDNEDMLEWARDVFADGSSQFPFMISREDVETIKDEGYDGIQVWFSGSNEEFADEFIVFDPKQIKSATSNIGAFDPEDDRIAFSEEAPDV